MAAVWRRPGLTALEVCWRWAAGVPLLVWLLLAGARALRGVHPDVAGLQAMTVFQPVAAMATLRGQLLLLAPSLVPLLRLWAPLALLVWVAAAAFGRRAIWRRLEGAPHPPFLAALQLSLLRVLLLLGFYALWLAGVAAALRWSVTGPARSGAEPNLVLLTALVVFLTLAVFLLWCGLAWALDVAPLLADDSGNVLRALGRALRQRALRSKLVEINLVMGIVKVALLVLAMVFCATPLPFASEESTAFLVGWWSFVVLLFLCGLDFFHVVRRAVCVAFLQALPPCLAASGPPTR